MEFGAGKGLLSHGIAKGLELGEHKLSCEYLMDSMKDTSINNKKSLKERKKQEDL